MSEYRNRALTLAGQRMKAKRAQRGEPGGPRDKDEGRDRAPLMDTVSFASKTAADLALEYALTWRDFARWNRHASNSRGYTSADVRALVQHLGLVE